eukprot:m.158909 g.158909  ORF g.158909 m.158909 type:complete len:405 (+) comp15143_c0_seq2:152-1366(+)
MASMLFFCFLLFLRISVEASGGASIIHKTSFGNQTDILAEKNEYTLVVCIGVAPLNFARREALRNSWLQWIDEADDAMYLFVTEKPGNDSAAGKHFHGHIDMLLDEEQKKYQDMIFQTGPSGYNTFNGMRELWHIKHFSSHFKYKYYLRVDDDGFLCVRQLLEELRWYMPKMGSLLHGRYHCSEKKARMDENYLLMSRDVANLVARGFESGMLPFNPKLTFALNLGNIVPLLQKEIQLRVFDDRERFCWPYKSEGQEAQPCRDAWMGKLATLRNPDLSPQFCDQFMWSHWVKEPQDFVDIYKLQINSSETDTMQAKPKESPFKPSTRMQHVFRLYEAPVCRRMAGFENGIPFYRELEKIDPEGINGMKSMANGSHPELAREISHNITKLWKYVTFNGSNREPLN